MASINDIQIKALKKFRDHEGCEIAQGNIYYKGKKLGFWSQDSWGGCDQYHFDEHILDNEVALFKEHFDRIEEQYRKIISLDTLIYELINLSDTEKDYKKGIKRGFKSYVYATDGLRIRGFYHISDDVDVIKSDPYYSEFIEKCRKEFFKNMDVTPMIFTKPEDFNWVYRG